MTSIGIRCTPTDFSFTIIEGSLKNYRLIAFNRLKYPQGYNRCELLKWLYLEMGEIIKKYSIYAIGVKGTEAMGMKGKSYGDRMELEGMIFLQASISGIKYAIRKVNSTIAKDIGLKGKAKYLSTEYDYSTITEYSGMSKNLQEATQVAISMLK